MTKMSNRLRFGVDLPWRVAGFNLYTYVRHEPQRAQRSGVWLLAVGQTIGYAGLFYIFAALLLTWDSNLDWGKERLTLAFMIAIFASAAVSPIAGRIVDRGATRWLLSGGMVIGALALFGLGAAQSYHSFVLCWIFLGAAQGLSLYEPCFAFITRATRDQASGNIACITLLAGFASTIALPAGALLADTIGWRGATWVFAGMVGFVGAPLMYAGVTLIETHTDARPADRGAVKDIAAYSTARRRPEFWLIYWAFPLISFTAGLILVHIIPILTDSGMSLAEAIAVVALFGPMQVVGRLSMMYLVRRIQSLAMTAVSFFGVLAAIFMLLIVEDMPVAAFIFSILFGACYGVVSILKPLVTYEVLGQGAFGKITGVMAIPFFIALAVSPQAGSYLWRIGGYELALKVVAISAFLALIVLLTLHLVQRARR